MTRVLMALGAALLAGAVLVHAEQREWVSSGEVQELSAASRTLTLEEIAEPSENARPGTMQSGVIRPFTVAVDTKITGNGKAIDLADIHVGDSVTIHYVLDGGKNVTRSIALMSRATE